LATKSLEIYLAERKLTH